MSFFSTRWYAALWRLLVAMLVFYSGFVSIIVVTYLKELAEAVASR